MSHPLLPVFQQLKKVAQQQPHPVLAFDFVPVKNGHKDDVDIVIRFK